MTTRKSFWARKRVLITAGPTREHLDPVRFLGNASSGKMGFALARIARGLGATVRVVAGPAPVSPPRGVSVTRIVSAEEMYRECLKFFEWADVVIGAAAVGDWRFAGPSNFKIKKNGSRLRVELVPNPDLLAEMGRRQRQAERKKVLVGFALETDRWLENAARKLEKKRLDLIVANGPDGMGKAHIEMALIDRSGGVKVYPAMSKARAAQEILRRIEKFF